MNMYAYADLDDRDQRIVAKYLEKYAEPESHWQSLQLARLPSEAWEYVVTIPACGEDEYLPGALQSISNCQAASENKRVLCIVVLNGNEDRESEFSLSNKKMRAWFRENCTPLVSNLNPLNTCPQSLMSWRNIDILVVDRSQQCWLISAGQGVGLVRKIGADIALSLFVAGKISSPWIHATDADARVPSDYFLRAEKRGHTSIDTALRTSCVIYPYRHIPDDRMSKKDHDRYWPAVTEYECWLRYYVNGLQWAGSVYAYPSIGSLLACDALSYTRIRGFPKRMAGEDFYFQNKLSKIGEMITLTGEPVSLLTRPSSRVPFGTGMGTINIGEIKETGDVYRVYHPHVFDFLRSFLCAVKIWLGDTENDDQTKKRLFISIIENQLPATTLNNRESITWLNNLLKELHVFKNLDAAETRSKSISGALRQFNDWFDGFRTLKLIHRLRDEVYGSVPLLDALQSAAFYKSSDMAPEISGSNLQALALWLDWLRMPIASGEQAVADGRVQVSPVGESTRAGLSGD